MLASTCRADEIVQQGAHAHSTVSTLRVDSTTGCSSRRSQRPQGSCGFSRLVLCLPLRTDTGASTRRIMPRPASDGRASRCCARLHRQLRLTLRSQPLVRVTVTKSMRCGSGPLAAEAMLCCIVCAALQTSGCGRPAESMQFMSDLPPSCAGVSGQANWVVIRPRK